jgi:RNA polymerase-binding transcription factor DksA
MEKSFILQQKEALEKELKRIKEEIKMLKDYPDLGISTEDASLELEEFNTNVSIKKELEETLEAVQEALFRIEKGTYGICVKCGNPIEEERLKTLPYATHCATCQIKLKHKIRY